MSRSSIPCALTVASALLATTTSCQRSPGAVKPPSINSSSAGKLAMEQYDTNGDGKVAGDELDKAPSLKAALPRLDTDGDGGVSADELAARIEKWKGSGTGLMVFTSLVTLDGTPLPGATITFVPDPCLGDQVKHASCTTNAYGKGSGTIAKQDLPDPTYPGGMQLGIYTVKISKLVGGKETIPAKYNEHSILGQEAAPDVPEIANQRVIYALSSK
jgi:hypothetical protein